MAYKLRLLALFLSFFFLNRLFGEVFYCHSYDTLPSGWIGEAGWKAENGRLKHALNNTSGTTILAKKVKTEHLRAKNFQWDITVGIGDWECSGTNYFRYYLWTDTLSTAPKTALYLTVATGAIPLFIQRTGRRNDTLWRGDRKWNKNEEYMIRMGYDHTGRWRIGMKREAEADFKFQEVEKMIPEIFDRSWFYSGFLFRHQTASRSGKLWIDDLCFSSCLASPEMLHYELRSNRGIRLFYPSPIVAGTHNYTIRRNGNTLAPDSITTGSDGSVTLSFKLISGAYTVEAGELENIDGNTVPPESFSFTHTSSAVPGDIVINEIMFKPSGNSGLPKVEYLELYNMQDYDLLLDSVAFIDRGKIKDYLCDTIGGNGFLLLGGNSIEQLQPFGSVCKVKSFSLIDDGADIVLTVKDGHLLDSVFYQPAWIRDRAKRSAGGHAIERIRPDRLSHDIRNWHESLAEAGGTPGEANSTEGRCPDETPPFIVSVTIADFILLLFNEEVYKESASFAGNYRLEQGGQLPDSIHAEGNAIRLFYKNIRKGGDYTLIVQDIEDMCGNRMLAETHSFFVGQMAGEGDILINELLFDAEPPTAEYIELYNASNKRIALNTIRIAKRDQRRQISNVRIISDSAIVFEPHSLIWICHQPELVMAKYREHDVDNCFISHSSLSYNNEEGKIVVLNDKECVLDELVYDLSLHNAVIKEPHGVAIERIDHGTDTNNAPAWTSAGGDAAGGYGSPGKPNRAMGCTTASGGCVVFSCLPEVVTPDGDGYEDELEITVTLPEIDFTLTVAIYDASGRMVKQLSKGLPVHTATTLRWNGANISEQLTVPGIYIVVAEILQSNGKHHLFRHPCVVSR